MIKRLISSLILIPLAISCIIQGSWAFIGLIIIISYLILKELLSLFKLEKNIPLVLLHTSWVTLLIFLSYFSEYKTEIWNHPISKIALFSSIIYISFELITQKIHTHPLLSNLKIIALCTLSIPFFILIRTIENGLFLLLFILINIWILDSVAYFFRLLLVCAGVWRFLFVFLL